VRFTQPSEKSLFVSQKEGRAMKTSWQAGDAEGFATLTPPEIQVLDPTEERELLRGLADCKRKLAAALAQIEGPDAASGADDPQALAQHLASCHEGNGPAEARLGAIARRYTELRGKLALTNMRLVAHVAKRFRDRGIAYSDLLQEGFCGLLEAIDRFDLTHETKLATYATWWIRQAMQRAVAAGAYPVRLSPRHLRHLAQNQDGIARVEEGQGPRPASGSETPGVSTEMIHRIHTATRPAISLDKTIDPESHFSLLQTMNDPTGDRTAVVDRDETVGKLMQVLRPREQEVLALRFGLGGKPQLSLSQVGQVLEVSKERVRQLQDRALEKLRAAAHAHDLDDLLVLES
jgi:RNA polymerase primary sigma factor